MANACASHPDAKLADYFESHFPLVLPSLREVTPCLSSDDVGNPAFPVVLRASVALAALMDISASPSRLRPWASWILARQHLLACDFLAFVGSERGSEFASLVAKHAAASSLQLSPQATFNAGHTSCSPPFSRPSEERLADCLPRPVAAPTAGFREAPCESNVKAD